VESQTQFPPKKGPPGRACKTEREDQEVFGKDAGGDGVKSLLKSGYSESLKDGNRKEAIRSLDKQKSNHDNFSSTP